MKSMNGPVRKACPYLSLFVYRDKPMLKPCITENITTHTHTHK